MENDGRRNPAGSHMMKRRQQSSINDLIEDLLELVLLHIPSRIGLVRAAATCKLWRSLIAGGSFLRRFRSLHGPEVLGHYYLSCSSHSAFFDPTPKEPGWAEAVDVTVDYLKFFPRYLASSLLTDSRGGLLAILCLFNTITVCNPWTRQQNKFETPFQRRETSNYHAFCLGAFLLDSDADTEETGSMSHFKVLCACLFQQRDDASKKIVEADVYSARDGRWLPLSTTAVGDIADIATYRAHLPFTKPVVFLGRVSSSLFWFAKRGSGVFQLNESSGQFSSITLPRLAGVNEGSSIHNRSNLRVVGGDAGAVRLVRIVGGCLEVLRRSHSDVPCVLDRRVCLSQLLTSIEGGPNMSWRFVDSAHTAAQDRVVLSSREDDCMFILDVETMKLVSTEETNGWPDYWVLSYELPWPPIIKVCM